METRPAPSSFHVDHADIEKSVPAAYKRQRDRKLLLVYIVRHLIAIVFVILLPIYFFVYDMPPEFSVQLLPAINTGLNMPTAAAATGGAAASISPAFNATLHASNRRATERCYHNAEALVSYAGLTVATGRVPEFCVPGKGAGEIRFQASAGDGGVGLPEHLLDRMALERRVGATQLDVEVKLFRRDDGSDRPMWIWCGLRMDDDGTRPPDVAPCTVLGLQNWFSVPAF
ncbi:unnamed protein product [Urochloa decumbens]|uniref:Late embryogenesis abundant protein LEA-2 subgroup domain-containing protein n=1 Tax=Urochloa decumbens TaxID=240449 RepID=A0ABC9A9M2_9POAL